MISISMIIITHVSRNAFLLIYDYWYQHNLCKAAKHSLETRDIIKMQVYGA